MAIKGYEAYLAILIALSALIPHPFFQLRRSLDFFLILNHRPRHGVARVLTFFKIFLNVPNIKEHP
jgi:hypothetical protein